MSFRCNLVTLDGDIMEDNSAHHVSNETGARSVEALNAMFASEGIEFHKGLGFRNLMVMRNVDFDLTTTAPHDIMGKSIKEYLPKGKGAEKLIDVMQRAEAIFSEGDYERANGIWFWGEGKRPSMPLFKDLYSLESSVVAAVDLIRGIGRFAGMEIIDVPGATGFIDTNFEGKAEYAIKALEKSDYVFFTCGSSR